MPKSLLLGAIASSLLMGAATLPVYAQDPIQEMESFDCLIMPATEETLRQLLQERVLQPERAAEIDTQIYALFNQTLAVMVVDMAGFSSQTQDEGIIAALAQIEQMRSRTRPIIEDHQGILVKADADNLYVVFNTPDQALAAATDLRNYLRHQTIGVSIGIDYGDVLLIEQRELYGNTVNRASKLGEDLAEHNEILITDTAIQHLTNPAQTVDVSDVQISGLTLRVHHMY